MFLIIFVFIFVYVGVIVVDIVDSGCPRIKLPHAHNSLKNIRSQKNNRCQISFLLQDILFRAVFMVTGRARVNFYE